ncbi:MAG: hypothetical protein R3343_02485 [Nitriliruptorales bacterium]|nr:hypothetical protein [Nitriliruptorales bacterium]
MTEDPRSDARPAGDEEPETERELRELREDLDIPTRGASVYVFLAILAAAAAVWGIWPIVTGPLGMILGLIGHVKGHRRGFAAAIIAGVATVIGMAVTLLLFNPFSAG